MILKYRLFSGDTGKFEVFQIASPFMPENLSCGDSLEMAGCPMGYRVETPQDANLFKPEDSLEMADYSIVTVEGDLQCPGM